MTPYVVGIFVERQGDGKEEFRVLAKYEANRGQEAIDKYVEEFAYLDGLYWYEEDEEWERLSGRNWT